MCSKDQMPNFNGDTPYSIMHGPDVCGFNKKVRTHTHTKCALGLSQRTGRSWPCLCIAACLTGVCLEQVHSIITDKKGNNLEMKATVTPKGDKLTHVHTFIIHPNNTYQVMRFCAHPQKICCTSRWGLCLPSVSPDSGACEQVLIDNKQERNGSLYEDYEFLLPRTIKVRAPAPRTRAVCCRCGAPVHAGCGCARRGPAAGKLYMSSLGGA